MGVQAESVPSEVLAQLRFLPIPRSPQQELTEFAEMQKPTKAGPAKWGPMVALAALEAWGGQATPATLAMHSQAISTMGIIIPMTYILTAGKVDLEGQAA